MNFSTYSPDQLTPANVAAERSILGAILLNNTAFDEAEALGLTASEMSTDSNRRIYAAMQRLLESGRPADIVTLPEELSNRNELVAVGDYGYVCDLLAGVPDRPSIRHYVRIVREKAAQRKFVRACSAGIDSIAGGVSLQGAMEQLGDKLLQIQAGSDDAPAERVIAFSDVVFTEWQQLANTDQHLFGLTTSLECVDVATTGVRPGELWFYGGRAGDGKTALSLATAAANCRMEIPVAIFSVEMRRDQLLQRLWSMEGQIPFQYIRNPRNLNSETRRRVASAMVSVGKWPLFVVDDGALSLQRLLAKARLLIRREKVRLLVVDYVQIISAPARDEKERLTKISNSLRALAKDTGVPIIAISQLGRPKNSELNARPNKFSLKESGSLENDAHVILMIYRPVDEFNQPIGKDELIIAKQRHGPISNERVRFDPKTLTFKERHT